MCGAGEALGDAPLPPHVVQRPAGAGVALGLGVDRPLHAAAEHADRGEEAERDAERQQQPVHVEDQTDAEDDEHRARKTPSINGMSALSSRRWILNACHLLAARLASRLARLASFFAPCRLSEA